MKGRKGSGHRFVVFKDGKHWYWHLRVSNSPSLEPAAISGRGYRSEKEARDSIRSVRLAVSKAPEEPTVEE